MKCFKRCAMLGVLFVLAIGTLSHFLYQWSGNNAIVGLFAPINESTWEHMKLLFFPMCFYSLFVIFKFKKNCPCIASSLCFGILAGTFLIPLCFYAYTSILGKDIFLLDIGIFILSVVITFWLSYKFALSCWLKPYTFLLCCLVCILFFCFLLFTYAPPKAPLFEAPF